MDTGIIISLALIVITYIWYISIIKKRNQVLESLSGIDVQLTKRNDLIPNILKIAKSFMEHEKTLISEVTALRAKIPSNYKHNDAEEVKEYFRVTNEMANKMANLLMQVENYPDLKTDQTMIHAQQTYNEVEEHISAARRFYNAAVTELNNSIQIFPGNLIAKIAGAKEMPFYKANENQVNVFDADKILK